MNEFKTWNANTFGAFPAFSALTFSPCSVTLSNSWSGLRDFKSQFRLSAILPDCTKICLGTTQLNLSSSNSLAWRFKTAATKRTAGQKVVCFTLLCKSSRLGEQNKKIKTILTPTTFYSYQIDKCGDITQWASVSHRNGQRLTRVPSKFRGHCSCCLCI